MDREDYPYCISCNAKMKWASFDNITSLLIFHCECGEFVHVEIELEDGEGLLSNPRSAQGRRRDPA